MTAWVQMSGRARGAVLGAAAVGVAVIGFAFWPRAVPPLPLAAIAPEAPAVVIAPEGGLAPDAPALIDVPPSFDSYRVDADGASLVAGRAGPGAEVTVMLGGQPVGKAKANARGEFVAQFTLPANPDPSLMTLSAVEADGATVPSTQVVALGAVAGPLAADVTPMSLAQAPSQGTPPVESVTTGSEPETVPGQAPDAVLVTDQGVRVVQGATPADAVKNGTVMLGAIAYDVTGNVLLSGAGQADGFVRLYLDQNLVATAPVGAQGNWSLTLTDTPPGVYTLRLDQVDAAGDVTSRFETPFKREAREALAALVGPAPEASARPEARAVAPDANPDANPAENPAASDPNTTPVADTSPLAQSDAPPAQGAVAMTQSTAPATATGVTPSSQASAPADPGAEAAPPASPPSVSITVQPGYTLWGIARQQLGTGVMYVQVFAANKDRIKNPDLIYPGQVFILPTR